MDIVEKKVIRIKFVEFEKSVQWRILLLIFEICILWSKFQTFLILGFFMAFFSPILWKPQTLNKILSSIRYIQSYLLFTKLVPLWPWFQTFFSQIERAVLKTCIWSPSQRLNSRPSLTREHWLLPSR